MKTFTQLKLFVLAAAMLGFSNIVVADINITGYGELGSGIKSPVFDQAGGGGSSGNMLSFNYSSTDGDASSLGTCAMNPMSSASNDAILEEFPITEPETYTPVTSNASTLASTGTTPPPTRGANPGTQWPPIPVPAQQNEEPPATPEPATMLMMGLGVVGLAPLMRRYRRK